jgi:GNAT superfamily N-acetyltransferase
MATTLTSEIDPEKLLIERALPEDGEAAEALWEITGARALPKDAPAARLVARDAATRRFLGVADYFRTFPPEDVLGAIAVIPTERRRGVGIALLQMLARVALRDGRRNLCAFIADDDLPSRQLVRSAGIPVRVYDVEGGFYIELDLVALLQEPVPDDARYVPPSVRYEG